MTACWLARWTCPPAPALALTPARSSATPAVAITADLKVGLQNADVLIDFTRPEGTLAHLAVCAELG